MRGEEIDRYMYTASIVERLLRNYWNIYAQLTGGAPRTQGSTYTIPKPELEGERPLGDDGSSPWPFQETRHARVPMDGKAKARASEELLVMFIDVTDGLTRLHKDDFILLRDYHIRQSHTLDELAQERQVTSRGSMHQRVRRAEARLAEVMNT